jgi:hypothetical protein
MGRLLGVSNPELDEVGPVDREGIGRLGGDGQGAGHGGLRSSADLMVLLTPE